MMMMTIHMTRIIKTMLMILIMPMMLVVIIITQTPPLGVAGEIFQIEKDFQL